MSDERKVYSQASYAQIGGYGNAQWSVRVEDVRSAGYNEDHWKIVSADAKPRVVITVPSREYQQSDNDRTVTDPHTLRALAAQLNAAADLLERLDR